MSVLAHCHRPVISMQAERLLCRCISRALRPSITFVLFAFLLTVPHLSPYYA